VRHVEQDAGGDGEVGVVEIETDVLVGDAGVEGGLDAVGAVDFADDALDVAAAMEAVSGGGGGEVDGAA
jgi:hypothetical protein